MFGNWSWLIGSRPLNTADLCGQNTDRGYNMALASGLPFWPKAPNADDIKIDDIAWHLARTCRFGGAIKPGLEIYSVAQHSVLVSHNVPPGYELEGLLHDAAEYIFGDRIKPIKLMMGEDIERAEKNLDRMIRAKFGLPLAKTPPVREADYRAVLTERRDVMAENLQVDWGEAKADPWPEKITSWPVFYAREQFLLRFEELTSGQVR